MLGPATSSTENLPSPCVRVEASANADPPAAIEKPPDRGPISILARSRSRRDPSSTGVRVAHVGQGLVKASRPRDAGRCRGCASAPGSRPARPDRHLNVASDDGATTRLDEESGRMSSDRGSRQGHVRTPLSSACPSRVPMPRWRPAVASKRSHTARVGRSGTGATTAGALVASGFAVASGKRPRSSMSCRRGRDNRPPRSLRQMISPPNTARSRRNDVSRNRKW